MITAEQAKALTPGTKVWMLVSDRGGGTWSEWVVYQPEAKDRWDDDPTILNYIISPRFGIKGYIFSNRLDYYSLTRRA